MTTKTWLIQRCGVAAVAAALGTASGCGRQPSDQQSPGAPPATTTANLILQRESMRVEWKRFVVPPRITAGETFPVSVEITNPGNQTWPASNSAPEYAAGKYAVRLTHRWCEPEATNCQDYVGRGELPRSLGPSQTITVNVIVTAPPKPGQYELQFDCLQELVVQFSQKGSPQLTIPVRVE